MNSARLQAAKACWLHILHIIILTISYTQLALYRPVSFVFWEILKNLKCIIHLLFDLNYFVLGSDTHRNVLRNHNQKPELRLKNKSFYWYRSADKIVCPAFPWVYAYSIVSAAIHEEKGQWYPISWYWWYKSLWSCSRQHSIGSCVNQQSFSTGSSRLMHC